MLLQQAVVKIVTCLENLWVEGPHVVDVVQEVLHKLGPSEGMAWRNKTGSPSALHVPTAGQCRGSLHMARTS